VGSDGDFEGLALGEYDGKSLGQALRAIVGIFAGTDVGGGVGSSVGSGVGFGISAGVDGGNGDCVWSGDGGDFGWGFCDSVVSSDGLFVCGDTGDLIGGVGIGWVKPPND